MKKIILLIVMVASFTGKLSAQSWTADNGNGTFTNPLFFEEFSDPCMVRVGSDFYLSGTTMHCMPGLPILHSRDLVNWRLISYVFDRFNLGPEFSFTDNKTMYGQGIWAPSFVYADSTFYIFTNVNGHTTQVYKSSNPYGPWEHWAMKSGFHDLSVFFDTDGKKYVCWGATDNYLAQLNEDLTDTIPGTKRLIAKSGAEGAHMYKVNGEYLIIWAVPGNNTPQLAGHSKNIYGPYQIDAICNKNHMGVHGGYGLKSSPWRGNKDFEYWGQGLENGVTLHQGGIIDTPTGEWWGYSMQDHNSLGRITNLSPITWKDGFPYFGLSNNLGKTPKTWVKPNVGLPQQPILPLMERDDDFSSNHLGLLWQWNHLPDDTRWSLTEAPGKLRMHSMPAESFWVARNTLTQRSIGMQTTCTVDIEANELQSGDVAGLALLNYPYAWIGIRKKGTSYQLQQYDQSDPEQKTSVEIQSPLVRLSVYTDFDTEKAQFYYSVGCDTTRHKLGKPFTMVFQLLTFQGVRYALFHYNEQNVEGGYADFDNFTVHEAQTKGLSRPIPYGKDIILRSRPDAQTLIIKEKTSFEIIDMQLGRVALKTNAGFISVNKDGNVSLKHVTKPNDEETFQWTELEDKSLVLLSLSSHRYLQLLTNGEINANKDFPSPNRKDGTRFDWNIDPNK